MRRRRPTTSVSIFLATLNPYRDAVKDILDEENPLEFDREEVEKLLEILQVRLEGFSRDGEVLAGAEGASQALGEDGFAGDLSSKGD